MNFKTIFQKIRKSEFSVAISTTGFTTALQMFTGVIINKIIAIKIGPTGIALLGQFINFRDIMTNAATGSFGKGVTKYIADPDYDEKQVISTSVLFSTGISLIFSLFIIAFAHLLTKLLFGVNEYKFIFYIFGTTLSFFSLNNLLISIINGKRKYKLLAKVKITNSLVALILSGLLCWYYGLNGALVAIALNTTIVLIISIIIIFKSKELVFVVKRSYWNNPILKKLLGFTLMALTSALLVPLVQLLLRTYIIEHASEFIAGIWESMKRISTYYNQVITVSLGVYYLPKLSSLKTNIELKNEIFKGIKIVMPIFLILASGIFFSRQFIINLLFSKEFMQMKDLFIPQLIGDFFMIFSFMIAYLMLAKAMIKTFIFTQVTMSCLRIVFSVFFFNKLGVVGVIWANALNYFIYFIIIVIIFRKILFNK